LGLIIQVCCARTCAPPCGMACHNAFLAVILDEGTLDDLDRIANALHESPSEMLGFPAGTEVGFDPMVKSSLHMTFLFFGEHLRGLPSGELRQVHAAIQAEVEEASSSAALPTEPLRFCGFELFPPGKMNLVVARFEATDPLRTLRSRVLAVCKEKGVSFPVSYFASIEGEGAWTPHVTLGKIRATRTEVGQASCGGGISALAITRPAKPLGITLLGARPPRAWCDWDAALSFGGEAPGADASPGLAPVAGSAAEAAAWAAGLLNDRPTCDAAAESKFRQFDANRNGLLEWSECVRLGAHLAALLGLEAPHQAKLHSAFAAFVRSTPGRLSEREFARFFPALVRGLLARRRGGREATAPTRPRPAPGPGADLTPAVLDARWAELTWRHEVVEFKGATECRLGSPLGCLSNFFAEAAFDFEVPLELCAESLGISDEQRRVRCAFSEKAIMLCKAAVMGDRATYFKVAGAEEPFEAKRLGKQVEPWDDNLWFETVCSVAYTVVYQKFKQIPACSSILLDTGESLIAEATRADSRWGIGLDKGDERVRRPSEWRGSNVLGWALAEVRAKLRQEEGPRTWVSVWTAAIALATAAKTDCCW